MNEQKYTWSRRGGYEVSSKGDKRFSALNAKIEHFNNLTIETLYQCTEYGKNCDPINLNWKAGKGKEVGFYGKKS